MEKIEHTDELGRKYQALKDGDIVMPLGPPEGLVDELGLPEPIATRLHNALYRRGILTYQDATRTAVHRLLDRCHFHYLPLDLLELGSRLRQLHLQVGLCVGDLFRLFFPLAQLGLQRVTRHGQLAHFLFPDRDLGHGLFLSGSHLFPQAQLCIQFVGTLTLLFQLIFQLGHLLGQMLCFSEGVL